MLCFFMDYELSYMYLRCQVICHVRIRHFCKMAKSDCYLRYVHLSLRIEQLALPLDGFSRNFIFDFISNFYVLLTVHLSIILDNDQRDAHLLYFTIRLSHSSTCFEHYTLIIRRLNCIDTASDIVLSRPIHT